MHIISLVLSIVITIIYWSLLYNGNLNIELNSLVPMTDFVFL